MKISIIGAGNVGSTLAERVLTHNLADVTLLDIVDGLAKGKAFDLLDASPLMGYERRICGTKSYEDIKGSEIIVITAGLPRKPGMSRDDLIEKNSGIIKEVAKNIKSFSPEAVVIVVTNPLDIMTYIAYKGLGCERGKVIGMAGNLDTARFKTLIAGDLDISPKKIEAYVLGSHGDTMVPLVSKTFVDGKPLEKVLNKAKIQKILQRTKTRGGKIVGLLKSGSAYFSPSAACLEILKAVLNDEKKIIPCSCILEGEYGIEDCSVGVPAKIGKGGILEILEWQLPENELEALKKSAKLIKEALQRSITHA